MTFFFSLKILKEFTDEKVPITFIKQNSRQMAYDRGLYATVRLIDIFDKQSHKKIVQYLGKRAIKELNLKSTPSTEAPKNDVINYLLSEDAHMLHQIQQEEQDERAKSEASTKMYKEAGVAKPPSDFMFVFDDDENTSNRSLISTEQLRETEEVQRRDVKREKDLPKQILNRIFDLNLPPESGSARIVDNSQLSFRSKMLKYQGYKIDLKMNEVNDGEAKKRNTSLKSGMSFYLNNEYEIKDIINTETPKNQEKILKKRLNVKFESTSQNSDLTGLDIVPENKLKLTNRIQLNSNRSSISSVPFKSTIVPLREVYFDKEKKFFSKQVNSVAPLSHRDQKDKQINKDLSKLNNYYYLNTLKDNRAATRPVIDECLRQHTNPLFPLVNNLADNSASTLISSVHDSSRKKILNPSVIRKRISSSKTQIASDKLTQRSKPVESNNNEFKYKSGNQIVENYLNSLKKSGLTNKNCYPVLKSSIVVKRNFIES